MTQKATGPLSGIRVLDLGHYIAGPLAGMLLADQGADVTKIVPPNGLGVDDTLLQIIHRGKRMLELDLKDPNFAEQVSTLIESSDVLIENFSSGVLDKLNLSKDRLKRLNPNLIVLSLPGYEPGDPLGKGVKAYEGVIAATSSQFTNIHAVRELFGLNPVYTALPLASVYAGVHGATSVVLALRERNLRGGAAHITAPLANAALSAMSSIFLDIAEQPERYSTPRLPRPLKNLVLPLMRRWAKSGDKAQDKLLNIARKSYPALMTSYPCRDGQLLYLFAIDNPKLVRRALSELGLLEAVNAKGLVFKDPYTAGDLQNNLSETSNLGRKFQAILKDKIASVLITDDALTWEQRLSEAGVPCAVQRSTSDWMEVPELYEAGIVTAFANSTEAPLLQPGVQAWVSDTPPEFARPNPSQSATEFQDTVKKRKIAATTKVRAPAKWLSDLTVIDMCSMVAGPVAGRTLAEYGARVIKVETPQPNHGPRMTCWYGVDGNPGKESILLDLKKPGGGEAMRALIAKADMLLTNHMPGAMTRLGMNEDDLRKINPELIITRIGAYNGPLGGPWAERNGYDPVLQAASGIMTRYGDPGHPELHAIASCVDALTGYSAAFGTALALYRHTVDPKFRTVNTSLAAAATLVQLPFAHNQHLSTHDIGGQTARGPDPFYQLYQTRKSWLFLAAPGGHVGQLPELLLPDHKLSGADLADHLQSVLRKRSLKEALHLFNGAGLSAVPVRNLDELSTILRNRDSTSSLRLITRKVDGLGPVTSVPAGQVLTDAHLLELRPAEKPGTSTQSILKELGLPVQNLLNTGAAAREISDEYLPS